MAVLAANSAVDWHCSHTWHWVSKNTAWCLLGCAIGDFGTIALFQFTGIPRPTLAIMILAITNGFLTSIALKTVILVRQMDLRTVSRTAIGMSFLSMIAMETMLNEVDWALTGGAIPIMLAAGFFTPLSCNYWRLKALGVACH